MSTKTGPKVKTVEFTLRLPLETRERLHKWAKRMGRSANAQLIHTINEEEPSGTWRGVPPK